ncbi:uncharacterized protein LACBIDRAFT_332792 [Laccaria bicolor S238N-H82]|uniref:Predicted protein n=1 Tax=Laccaria bicolor (strain S238N-H82 / ATCC MYA-4686) TaxID=486041 RepID=B0DTQ8_LACBS|nr:uncharacterized protein LACBIDRAFT_332792 [Laccaria bicolor S238N-H82]EDR02023.1 predicted protein [Laccaria bicolor S238N-H82]|eukprot:XP_001887414.1 predicted protein [Laccaria bicolor S238N-H82]
MPQIRVLLDVYHFMMRYLAVVLNGTRNPYRSQVAQDIWDVILKKPAGKDGSAEYWGQEEQSKRLCLAYEKWDATGKVWSASAAKVHADQLVHVRKGCLAHLCQDVASDGSRIEGSHKGWNSIMRSFSSGLEVYTALAHDFVLHRNLRVVASYGYNTGVVGKFVASTDGCHHLSLVDAIAQLFNSIHRKSEGGAVITLPVLPRVDSGETFGLVSSNHTETFGGLLILKEESLKPERQKWVQTSKAELQLHTCKMIMSQSLDQRLGESTTAPSSIHTFFKQTQHLTQQTLEITKVATARSSDPKNPQETQCVTIAAKPPSNTLEPLPLPGRHPQLTHSQFIFSVSTSINPCSLAIERKDEFFLFMEMRAEHQWVSFSMTCRKWVTATISFNVQLKEWKKGENLDVVKKNLHALMDKLAEVRG